ncbi:hydrophobic surface binding protein A-domain-containing protein [Cadophora sp. MPI-SDFR-AT-0126]|nr:hydrophobic surface binding protein A-domain-containing protein [Leotiomycetes sp. MPI-SDFR-AT-0126]
MKSSVVILALAATGNAAILARDAATVLSDIETLNSNTQSLTTAVNSFSGISDAAGLIAAESGLSDAINKATTDAKATTSVSDSEGSSILDAVKNFIPNIVAALNAVVSKDTAFTSAGVQSVVAGDIASLRTEASDFAAALIAAAPEGAKAGGNAAASCIDAAFENAIATKTADGSCASSVTFEGGSSATSAPVTQSSSAEQVPSSSAAQETSPSTSEGSAPAVSSSTGSEATSGAVVPYPTASTTTTPVVVGTGSAYPTSTGPIQVSPNSGASVKIGMTGIFTILALAIVL